MFQQRHGSSHSARFLIILICFLISACSGIGRHIEEPINLDRNYYIPEKDGFKAQSSLPDEFIQRGDVRIYRSHQAVDRYFPHSINQVTHRMPALMESNKPDALVRKATGLTHYQYQSPPLSPGDRLQIMIQEGEEFSGIYDVNLDGTVGLPLVPPVFVAGYTVKQAEQLIKESLIEERLFQKEFLRMSVHTQQWAPVQVQVQGAVFDPGLVTINTRSAEDRAQQSEQWSGDSPAGKLLNTALLAAGGIRPDANIRKVFLLRGDDQYVVDLSGVLQGNLLQLPALAAGDRIYVPSTGNFDGQLVRTSQITPPGIRVFLSNLTQPAASNASSAIGRHATSLPYGTRLLTAAMSANCVGGSAASNSNRTAVLVSRNPITGETEVIERNLENLVLYRNRDTVNPHIMPGDGIACYDSSVTNLREFGRTLTDILLPFSLF